MKMQSTNITCAQCRKSFMTTEALKQHVDIVHVDTLYDFRRTLDNPFPWGVINVKCPVCHKDINNQEEWTSHQCTQTHPQSRPSCICRVTGCDQQFSSVSERTRHESVTHNDCFYTCNVCPAAFQQFHELTHHMKGHEQAQMVTETDAGVRCVANDDESHLEDRFAEKSQVRQRPIQTYNYKSSASYIYTPPMADEDHNEFRKFVCNTCGKSFSRKHNLNQHMKRHETKDLECMDCGRIFSRPDSLKRHYTVQHGGADIPIPEKQQRVCNPQRPQDNYNITKLTTKYSHKFKTTSTSYNVKIRDIEVDTLPEILITLGQIFDSIIHDLTIDSSPENRIQIRIQQPELDFPIILPFTKQKDSSSDTILREIERVLQSYQEFVLDDTLQIDITHVELPYGTGKRKKYVNIDKYLTEKRCVIRIQNNDDICCARALVTGRARIEQPPNWESIRKGCSRPIQKELALALHVEAGVPIGPCGLEEVKQFQRVMNGYQINIISQESMNAIVYSGPQADKKIYLFCRGNHYDVITSVPAFFNKNYFCDECKKTYDHHEKHACTKVCGCCFKIHDECDDDKWIYCDKCNRAFKGELCFNNHAHLTRKSNSICKQYYICKDCKKLVNNKINCDHKCGETFCKTCKEYVAKDHQCFMKVAYSKSKNKQNKGGNASKAMVIEENIADVSCTVEDDVTRYIFFDFETTQDEGIHIVCENCLNADSCNICGEKERIFYGENTVNEFGTWLFSGENNGAICIAHNSKAFDAYFVLKYLHENGVVPKIIFNGNKIMYMLVPSCKIKFIDSINFFPMSLSKLPSAFGLTELSKGYFPHKFNTMANQDVSLSRLPDSTFYNPDGMKSEEKNKFQTWYKEHKTDNFNLKDELIKYCISDVDILKRACLRFRELFMEITSEGIGDTGIDPFQSSVTIASACNLVYRTKYLRRDTIAIIPPHGYHPEQRQSVEALQWMAYIGHVRNVRIQHARNDTEYRIGPYPVDGYYEQDGEKVVLQYEGCIWHGCPVCYPPDTVNPVNQLTMEELYQRTLSRKKYIESQGYKYEQQWGCDWNKTLKCDEEIRNFVDTLEYVSPLSPRDAFYGGRTEAFRLYHEVNTDEKIKYIDFTSLYPYINKYAKYPVGHPTLITEKFGDLSEYEGLIKCKIIPPRKLFLPVLPSRINGKLLFALCGKCAENKEGKCHHSDEDRALTGTWVIDEVRKAIEKGYRIATIYEIWHFSETAQYNPETKNGGLFTDYVNTFLKIKQEASGWPSECVTDEQKQRYIDDYFAREGIRLDPKKIEKNPGLRSLSKLCLNGFWGKFAERSNMTKTEYITDPKRYFDILTSSAVEVRSARLVTSEVVEVQWCYQEDFIEPSAKTNVIIAAFTTAHARLKLYDLMDSLGERVLYADTDSCVYSLGPGENDVPTGNYLGDLTDEFQGNYAKIFVAAGAKSCAYKLASMNDEKNITCCKIRGITQNYKNSLKINFETLSQMIRGIGPERVTVVDDHKIRCDKVSTNIVNKKESKNYKIVFDKRVIVNQYHTVPYGY